MRPSTRRASSGPPDGTEVAFVAEGELRRVRLDGGSLRTIIELEDIGRQLPTASFGFTSDTTNFYGGTWADDGTIYLGRFEGGLVRVPAFGGIPTLVEIRARAGVLGPANASSSVPAVESTPSQKSTPGVHT